MDENQVGDDQSFEDDQLAMNQLATNQLATNPDSQSSDEPKQYLVVARRYRPQSFGQLIGQQQVSQAIASAINTNRVGHAYLFTGARGVGKTSAARIFGKALNCVNGPAPEPCNQCDICLSVSTGEDVDVLEIDGASNRGIDEIRQLRQNVNVRPSRARYKIYIIDEVHMLTTPAFNALLKTLEEPPEHVKFIFCTTDPEKLPITVLSRCQRFDFSPVESKSIASSLQQIVDNEKIEAEPEALQILARRAAGSMRDSQSLLEQLLSFCGKKITTNDVHEMLGTAKSGRIRALVEKLLSRDAAGALAELNGSIGEGVDAGQFAEQLLGYLRDMMAASLGCDPDLMMHTDPQEFELIKKSGSEMGLETLLAVQQILDQSMVRMRQSVHVRTLLEIAIVRICKLQDLDSLSTMIEQLKPGKLPAPKSGAPRQASPQPSRAQPSRAQPSQAQPSRETTSASSTGSQSQSKPASSPPVRPQPTSNESSGTLPVPQKPIPQKPTDAQASGATQQSSSTTNGVNRASTAPVPAASQPPATSAVSSSATSKKNKKVAKSSPSPAENVGTITDLSVEKVEQLWHQTLDVMGDMTADLARKYDRLAISAPNKLVVTLKSAYNKDMCDRADRKLRLEQTLAEIAGRKIRVDFEVSNSPKTTGTPHNTAVTKRQVMRDLEDHPMVKTAMEIFDAEIVDVDLPRKPR